MPPPAPRISLARLAVKKEEAAAGNLPISAALYRCIELRAGRYFIRAGGARRAAKKGDNAPDDEDGINFFLYFL